MRNFVGATMLLSGIIVFIGVALVFLKLPRLWQLRLLGRPLAVDLVVSSLTLAVHWGTFSGVMAATVAGLLTSAATSVSRRIVGFVRGNGYVPGLLTLRI